MLASGSGLLKKCRLPTGRSGGAFQIEVRAHDQRRSLKEKAMRRVLVTMMSMRIHTFIGVFTVSAHVCVECLISVYCSSLAL